MCMPFIVRHKIFDRKVIKKDDDVQRIVRVTSITHQWRPYCHPGGGGGATLWVVLARASPDNSPPHRSPLVISFLTHPTAYTSILIFIRSPSFTILLALLQDSCNVEAPKLDYFLSYSFIYDHDYVSARFVSLSVSLSLSLIPFLS